MLGTERVVFLTRGVRRPEEQRGDNIWSVHRKECLGKHAKDPR